METNLGNALLGIFQAEGPNQLFPVARKEAELPDLCVFNYLHADEVLELGERGRGRGGGMEGGTERRRETEEERGQLRGERGREGERKAEEEREREGEVKTGEVTLLVLQSAPVLEPISISLCFAIFCA